MPGHFRKLFAGSPALNMAMGDVVDETDRIQVPMNHGCVWVRIKQVLGGDDYLVGRTFRPDMHAGPTGSVMNHICFDLEGVERPRDALDDRIERSKRLTRRPGR